MHCRAVSSTESTSLSTGSCSCTVTTSRCTGSTSCCARVRTPEARRCARVRARAPEPRLDAPEARLVVHGFVHRKHVSVHGFVFVHRNHVSMHRKHVLLCMGSYTGSTSSCTGSCIVRPSRCLGCPALRQAAGQGFQDDGPRSPRSAACQWSQPPRTQPCLAERVEFRQGFCANPGGPRVWFAGCRAAPRASRPAAHRGICVNLCLRATGSSFGQCSCASITSRSRCCLLGGADMPLSLTAARRA
jgi:hypothetical protein